MANRNDIQYVRFYTDGSAARKIAPSFNDFGKISQPKEKKIKRILVFVDPVALLGIAVAVCMLICMGAGIARNKAAHKQTEQMQQYVQQLNAEKDVILEDYTSGYDLQTVKQTALALGMIPREQAQRVSLEVTVPVQEQTVTLWARIGTFLAGLLA